MIEAKSNDIRYQTQFTNKIHSAISDNTKDKGGNGSGFRPHELLEAAFATCMNMTLRMYADQHDIPLSNTTTRVTLDRTLPGETIFEYEIDLEGSLSQEQRDRLLEIVKKCPVRQTLSKRIGFRER